MAAAAQQPAKSSSRPGGAARASLVPEERVEEEEEDERERHYVQKAGNARCGHTSAASARHPLILITDPSNQQAPQSPSTTSDDELDALDRPGEQMTAHSVDDTDGRAASVSQTMNADKVSQAGQEEDEEGEKEQQQQYEEIDGISYRIVAAVTKPPVERSSRLGRSSSARNSHNHHQPSATNSMSSFRRKSSAFVANLGNMLNPGKRTNDAPEQRAPRRLSIYEMTKSPPPETSLEMYLNERRRSSTVSSKRVQQQLQEQQTTFETNYCQRQQYFKDLNRMLINRDNKLLNVVANRGQIHRHSVDIAQLPLSLAQAKANLLMPAKDEPGMQDGGDYERGANFTGPAEEVGAALSSPEPINHGKQRDHHHASLRARDSANTAPSSLSRDLLPIGEDRSLTDQRVSDSSSLRAERSKKPKAVVRKFQQLDQSQLISTPAPDVKIGQRIAFKEYYGSEFGTIRWIGRVPQISPDWTVGVEFDNAIGEGDGSLHGRRYFIAKDCFAKFLPLNQVTLVEQHVGRPEPGTMISVMSAAVRPGQMISIQRVSTVHVQHCFLNAPHHRPGADILAVNTRLHCQCPSCGPCAHVIKPPRTQRISHNPKNATHMCQFSTYTCCGMESQEEALCTYTGNKITASLPPPISSPSAGLPPVGNSWIEGSGYLASLQAQQSKLVPEEYRIGAIPEDIDNPEIMRRLHKSSSTSRHNNDNRNKRRHRSSSRQIDSNSTSSPCTEGPILFKDNDESLKDKQLGSNVSDNLATGLVRKPSDSFWESETFTQLDKRVSFEGDLELTRNVTRGEPHQNLDSTDEISDGSFNSRTIEIHSIKSDGIFTRADGKVPYEHSIENRYLFPDDDNEPIDSNLEADLENLSQARYGTKDAVHHRRAKPSKYIFRSLRSLVSCLNAPSTSEIDVYSETNVAYPILLDRQSFTRSLPSDNVPEYSESLTPLKIDSCD